MKTFAEHGFRYLELSEEHSHELLRRGDPEKTGAALRRVAEDHGVQILQGHYIMTRDGWVSERARENVNVDVASDDPEEQAFVLEIMKRWVDLFEAVGIAAGVYHVGGHTLLDRGVPEADVAARQREMLAKVCAFTEGKATRIAIENLAPGMAVDCATIKDTLAALPKCDLGICLDTGHAFMHDVDVADFVRQAGDLLAATHITDCVVKKESDHYMPFSAGMIDWARVMPALAKIGYQGLFNFEIPRENQCPMPVRLAKLDYLGRMADFMIGELAREV